MKKEEENACTIVDYSQTCILYIFMVGIGIYCCWYLCVFAVGPLIVLFLFIFIPYSHWVFFFVLCCVFQEKYCACKASSYFTLLVETK